jgi:ABC-type nitrate/sulfonate/bicarbonate transport system substrate-binding protein
MKSVPDIKLRFEALLSNSLETAVLPEPLVTSGENEGGRVLISDTDLSEDYSQTVYIFRKEYLDNNSDKVKRFLESIVDAGKIINEDPNKYLPLVSKKPEFLKNFWKIIILLRLR